MSPRGRIALWTATSFCAALCLSAAVLMALGTGDQGIRMALRATARLMFLLFLPAYVGGALASLFGSRFKPAQRHAREFGLAFATALVVHLGLVAWLCLTGDLPPLRTFVIFGAATLCVCLLMLFSIGRLQRMLGARGWSLLHMVGMNYVAFAFADDFLRNPLATDIQHALLYWPFAALAIVGPALRVIAGANAMRESRSASHISPAENSAVRRG